MKYFLWLIATMSLTGCLGMPETVKPVQGFEVNRYMGEWYEIARLDHSFERELGFDVDKLIFVSQVR